MAASSSAAPERWCGSLRASIQHPLDLVQHCRGYVRLRGARHLAAPIAREDDHLVLVAVDPDLVPGHVVVDEQVEPLPLELAGRAREPVAARLGGEADEHLPVLAAFAELEKDIT